MTLTTSLHYNISTKCDGTTQHSQSLLCTN